MTIKENRIITKDYLTKSKLPASDFVINPYVGCTHACKYCYARFMKRFTGHLEPWGEFIDIKECTKPIDLQRIKGKSVFLSSVTDCYNPYEKTYGITRSILKQLVMADSQVTISTKSNLILRDIDILQQFQHLKVALSINTLDENFRNDMDQGSSITERVNALKKLHTAGIDTVLFLSPIFPYITKWKEIIDETKNHVSEYWFENLNLRGEYKNSILSYINDHYPEFYDEYQNIYLKKDNTYWITLADSLATYCDSQGINYINFFYHNELVKQKECSS